MKATVLKDFHYSHDGVRSAHLREGETHLIRPELFDGLARDGFIEAPREAPEAAPTEAEADSATDAAGEGETPASDAPAGESDEGEGEDSVTDPLDELARAEEAEDAGDERAFVVRHVSRGKYDVFRGTDRITSDLMTKEEAEAKRAELAGA